MRPSGNLGQMHWMGAVADDVISDLIRISARKEPLNNGSSFAFAMSIVDQVIEETSKPAEFTHRTQERYSDLLKEVVENSYYQELDVFSPLLEVREALTSAQANTLTSDHIAALYAYFYPLSRLTLGYTVRSVRS